MQIYVHRGNQQLGPFTEAEIKAQLASGAISLQDQVWWQGQSGWVPLSQTPYGGTGNPPLPTTPVIPGAAASPHWTPPVQSTSNLAIWSLVCGCLSLLCGVFASIPAIILGHLALGDIKKTSRPGRGLALAGLIIGYIMTVLGIIGIVIYITMLPTIMKQVQAAAAAQGQAFPNPFTNTAPSTPSDSDTSTNTEPATSTPDQSTNATPPPVNSPDAMTNSPTTNSPPATP
jgi:hypothetical protein